MTLRETLEKIRSNPVPANEETAKFQILAPILAEIGWDPFGPEVLLEHPVGATKSGGRVDIALRAEEHIQALIEAKTPGSDLRQHVSQVLGYAFHEGVDICVLTDGLQWWLYLPLEKGPPERRRFAVMSLNDDPVDQLCDDLTTFLGWKSLLNGQAHERARQVLKARLEAAHLGQEMPRIWQEMLEEPDDELVELIGQRVYDRLSLRPQREQIIAAMAGRPIPPVHTESTEPTPPPKTPAPRTSKPTAILLWGVHHSVKSHIGVYLTVVEELWKRHPDDFDRTVEHFGSSRWQYVSRDASRMRDTQARRIPSGHYVDTNLSAKNVAKRSLRLLKMFGYGESDLEYSYEDAGSSQPPAKVSSPPAGRPTAIRLWGERHAVKTFQEILVTVVHELYSRHPDRFDQTVEDLRTRNWQFVSRDPSLVRGNRTREIPSGHHLDVNLSAADITKRCTLFLEAFGYCESDLEYLYED